MPFYQFKCPKCNFELQELRKMNDFKEPLCQKCSTVLPKREVYMKKIIGTSSFIFKGDGFYETDYKKPKIKLTSGGKEVKIYDTPEEAQERAEDAAKKAEDSE